MTLKLSVLDQSVAASGLSQDAAIRETLGMAEHCEALGYHRFWVSEHHSHPTIVGSAPEVLMAAIAARTQRIRIGSAGVMLPHYAAFKVAEQFRVLEALAPGRIDLGLGRAPGSDFKTAQLLNPNRHASEDFPRQIVELSAWVNGQDLPLGHPGHGIAACPTGPTAPTLWILGSSDYGAQLAAHLGLPYAFAYFITEGQGAQEALALYRNHYRPSEKHPKPTATACVWVLAADTEEQAHFEFQSRARWRMDRNRGALGPLIPPGQAQRAYTAEEMLQIEALHQRAIVGNAQQVGAKLRDLAKTLAVDELVLITWTHDPQVRRRSCELIGKEFRLF
jgi:luciferase family oxidoreductase group 1